MKYIICIILLVTSCKHAPETKKTTEIEPTETKAVLTDAQLKTAGLTYGTLTPRHISKTIRVNGKIEVPPQNLVSISSPFGGYLKSTKLLPGMAVSKGQVIATMEDVQYVKIQQEYLTSKAKLVMAEAEFKRQKELNESKASSDKVYQSAQAEYQTLKIALSALTEQLKFLNINPAHLSPQNLTKTIKIYAPFTGYVSKVNVNIGKFVSPSDVMFELINPSDIHLNLKVFEKDLIQLSVGQKIEAYTNSNPNEKHNCNIILISKDLATDGTAEVHCHFNHFSNKLFSGMYMNADIELKSHDVMAVDEHAVVTYEAKNYIFLANANHTFDMKEVALGKAENGYVEILHPEPLMNQKIVTKGAYALLMSLKNKAEE